MYYKIEVFVDGRWMALGGCYGSREEAERKVVEFMWTESRKRRRSYRIVRV